MSEWKEYKLEDFAEINPTKRLAKGTIAKKIAMEVIQPFTKKIPAYSNEEYKGGIKFKNGDTIMARITPSRRKKLMTGNYSQKPIHKYRIVSDY